jgi:hypothetical protein
MIPLKWLREFIVSLANLAEAEGRALRGGILRLSVGLGGLLVAAMVLFGGLGLVLAALIVALDGIMATAWALLIGGIVCVLLAGGVAWAMLKLAK